MAATTGASKQFHVGPLRKTVGIRVQLVSQKRHRPPSSKSGDSEETETLDWEKNTGCTDIVVDGRTVERESTGYPPWANVV